MKRAELAVGQVLYCSNDYAFRANDQGHKVVVVDTATYQTSRFQNYNRIVSKATRDRGVLVDFYEHGGDKVVSHVVVSARDLRGPWDEINPQVTARRKEAREQEQRERDERTAALARAADLLPTAHKLGATGAKHTQSWHRPVQIVMSVEDLAHLLEWAAISHDAR